MHTNNKSKLEVSVIIPTYNREGNINYCINSILSQSYLPNEIIVVDDFSHDNTVTRLKELNNSLIKIISLDMHGGSQYARNIGIKAAKSDWIAFLDSDDTWERNKLEKQVNIIEQNNSNPFLVVNSKCYRKYEADKKTEVWDLPIVHGPANQVYKQLLIKPGPMFQGLLTSKIALEKIGYLDESIISYQEWDVAICLAKVCDYHWINEPLFTYQIGIKETKFRKKETWTNGYLSILKKHESEIIYNYGKKKISGLIYSMIKQIMEWTLWEFGNKSIKSHYSSLTIMDYIKLKFYCAIKTKPSKFAFLKYYIQNPINGIKHLLRKIIYKPV